MATSQKVAQTAQTWYQSKRVPLYVLVGTTVTGAASYLYTRIRNPQTQADKESRMNALYEVEANGANSPSAKAGQHGATCQSSPGRDAVRAAGLMDGQNTSGIMPNEAIANAVRGLVGAEHDENAAVLERKHAATAAQAESQK